MILTILMMGAQGGGSHLGALIPAAPPEECVQIRALFLTQGLDGTHANAPEGIVLRGGFKSLHNPGRPRVPGQLPCRPHPADDIVMPQLVAKLPLALGKAHSLSRWLPSSKRTRSGFESHAKENSSSLSSIQTFSVRRPFAVWIPIRTGVRKIGTPADVSWT